MRLGQPDNHITATLAQPEISHVRWGLLYIVKVQAERSQRGAYGMRCVRLSCGWL